MTIIFTLSSDVPTYSGRENRLGKMSRVQATWGKVTRQRESGGEGQNVKAKCCQRYKRKGKACHSCPVMARLGTKEQKKLLKRYK
jgi:hypothetical protein